MAVFNEISSIPLSVQSTILSQCYYSKDLSQVASRFNLSTATVQALWDENLKRRDRILQYQFKIYGSYPDSVG